MPSSVGSFLQTKCETASGIGVVTTEEKIPGTSSISQQNEREVHDDDVTGAIQSIVVTTLHRSFNCIAGGGRQI